MVIINAKRLISTKLWNKIYCGGPRIEIYYDPIRPKTCNIPYAQYMDNECSVIFHKSLFILFLVWCLLLCEDYLKIGEKREYIYLVFVGYTLLVILFGIMYGDKYV